jgi:hypothetical protein
MSLKKRTTSP